MRPLVEYARRYAATLTKDGAVANAPDLAALLVESLSSRASGVPACAGLDLVRHEELVAALTPAQREAVDAAVAVPRKADLDLAAVVDAAGVAGTNASDATLVARLLESSTRALRLNLTAAMRRHARPELVVLLASKLADATPQQRADLVNAMGRLDRREAAPHLAKALDDAEKDVRVEAAHSLGLLARAVRAPAEGTDAEAPRDKLAAALAPLVTAAGAAKTEHEKRAACWAIAQIDTAESWAALKKLRDEAADPRVREIAGQYALRPRVELILE
jgi:HEAT repeat protein